jgi:hypothetical protein
MNPNNLIRIVAMGVLVVLTGCGEKGAADTQMQELCAKDGGVKIYETVKLSKSEFDQWGMPLGRYWANQSDPENKLGPNYRYVERSEFLRRGDTLRGEVQMFKSHQKIFRRSDGKLLGESVEYGRSGGDPFINRILGGHPSSSSCPDGPNTFFASIFIKGE